MAGYRTAYTHEDRITIVQYIIKSRSYNALRGNAFWQEMEAQKILNRSWQSLKEHFKKKIIDMIHTFPIPQKEKRLIREGWEISKTVTKNSNGKKVKRPRHTIPSNFSDEDSCHKYVISDDSDSTSASNPNTKPRRKNPKSSGTVKIPVNFFSDEEDPTSKRKEKIQHNSSSEQSADLFDRKVNKNKNIKDHDTPSTSGLNFKKFKKNNSLLGNESNVDSNSNEVPVELDTTDSSTDIGSENFDEPFSLEEEILLLNFMKKDKVYLKSRTQISIYECFRDIYPESKSAKRLKDRFLNHIFPNVYKYELLTYEEMCRFYEEADVDIPKHLILSTKDSAPSPNKSKNADVDIPKHLKLSTEDSAPSPNKSKNADVDIPKHLKLSTKDSASSPNKSKNADVDIPKHLKLSTKDSASSPNKSKNADVDIPKDSAPSPNKSKNADVDIPKDSAPSPNKSKNADDDIPKDSAPSPNKSENADKELEIIYDSNTPIRNADIVKKDNNDFTTNVCEHELYKSGTDYIYCSIILNNQPHLFVSTETKNKENLITTLSKKKKIAPENIHILDFMSFSLLEQVNKFRNTILKQFGNVITTSLGEYYHDINMAEVVSSFEVCIKALSNEDDSSSETSSSSSDLSSESRIMNMEETINTQVFNSKENSTPEVCIQAFSNEDDSSSETSNSACDLSSESRIMNMEETINTQVFNPKENSTPEKVENMSEEEIDIGENIQLVDEMPQIKIEIRSEDSAKTMSPSFSNNAGNDESENISDSQEELENSKSKTNQNNSSKETSINVNNSENDEDENINVMIDYREELENDKSETNKNESQYLESVLTPESCELRNTIVNMTAKEDMPSSSEAFHTALSSQDLQQP